MKTTIELPDALLEQARELARQEGSSMRRLMEEGLQRAVDARQRRQRSPLEFPTFGGSGLTTEFEGAGWAQIRAEIYPEPPAGERS